MIYPDKTLQRAERNLSSRVIFTPTNSLFSTQHAEKISETLQHVTFSESQKLQMKQEMVVLCLQRPGGNGRLLENHV